MSRPLSIGRRNWHFAWSGDGSGYARYRRLRVFYGRGPFCAECGRCHWRSCNWPVLSDGDAKVHALLGEIKAAPEVFAAALERELARGAAATAMLRVRPSHIERMADQWARGLDICGWWFWPLQTFLLGICVGMLVR